MRTGRTDQGEAPFIASSGGDKGLVLIVEDDEDSRFVYGLILADHGFDVVMATSGDEGLRIARDRAPSAVLMDVSIPGLDGWTVTEMLKDDPRTADIPVIVITAHAFPEDADRAKTARCEGFLTKPCEPRRVLEEVCKHVERPEP